MKKFLKWTLIILLIIVVGLFITGYYLVSKADKTMVRKFTVEPIVFPIPTDSASIAHGKLLTNLCKECHGKNFEGYAFFNDPKLGRLSGPNLTLGKGSAVSYYTDKDWIAALRHGVRPNGDGLMVMPAKDYNKMSKEDLGSVIAFIKSLPPVDHETEKNYLTTMGKILLSMGAFGEIHSAAVIDHSKGPGSAPVAGPTASYGEYMVHISGCQGCHQEMLNGGKHPDPNSPPVPNLTPAGNLKNWNSEQFIQAIRTGKTPEGKQLNGKFMPYSAYAGLSDVELGAIFIYLQSLKPLETAK